MKTAKECGSKAREQGVTGDEGSRALRREMQSDPCSTSSRRVHPAPRAETRLPRQKIDLSITRALLSKGVSRLLFKKVKMKAIQRCAHHREMISEKCDPTAARAAGHVWVDDLEMLDLQQPREQGHRGSAG